MVLAIRSVAPPAFSRLLLKSRIFLDPSLERFWIAAWMIGNEPSPNDSMRRPIPSSDRAPASPNSLSKTGNGFISLLASRTETPNLSKTLDADPVWIATRASPKFPTTSSALNPASTTPPTVATRELKSWFVD